jgi:predicted Zn-dependent peptidase
MNVMKLMRSWEDAKYSIHNDLYELSNGINLLHAINPASLDSVFSAVVRAGSCFEPLAGVSTGTAHFLEHLLVNPNDVFPTQKDVDAFEFGGRTRPRLEINAGTSKKYLYLYGYCNAKGQECLLTRVESMLAYPSGLFRKYVEKEREVILAEMTRKHKPEKDQEHNYNLFLVGDVLPHFKHRIIGSREDVSSVTVNEIEAFREKTFLKENVIFSLQSPGEIEPSLREKLEEMAAVFDGGGTSFAVPEEHLENTYRSKHFYDEREDGVFISLNYFFPVQKKLDYKEKVLFALLADLIGKLGYDILRVEKGLVYAFETFRFSRLAFDFDVRGFKCSTETRKLKKLLAALEVFIFNDLTDFLGTDDGVRWFDNSVSRYVFPNTTEYDPDYAETRSLNVLEDCEVYLFDKAVEVAKGLLAEDLIRYIDDNLHNLAPHVWMVSSEKEAEIVGALE